MIWADQGVIQVNYLKEWFKFNFICSGKLRFDLIELDVK